jgi:hypothetical protein
MAKEITLTGARARADMLEDPEISLDYIKGVYPNDAVVSVDDSGRLQRIVLAHGVSVDRATAIQMKKAGAVRVRQSGWDTLTGSYALNFLPRSR